MRKLSHLGRAIINNAQVYVNFFFLENLTTHRTEIATMQIVQNRSHPDPIAVVTQLTRSTGWRGMQFINDERNRSHFNGLGKTNISQRVNLTQSLGFSLILLDQDRSVSKGKAFTRGDDSDESGHDYRLPSL